MKKDPQGKRWHRLDNTGKIFPMIANENLSNVFRISVILKHDIVPNLLQQALQDTLPMFKGFKVKLKRGFFWYYFGGNLVAACGNLLGGLVYLCHGLVQGIGDMFQCLLYFCEFPCIIIGEMEYQVTVRHLVQDRRDFIDIINIIPQTADCFVKVLGQDPKFIPGLVVYGFVQLSVCNLAGNAVDF